MSIVVFSAKNYGGVNFGENIFFEAYGAQKCPKNTPITTHMNIKHWSKTPHYTSQELYFIQRCFQQYQMMHTTPTWYL